MEDDSAILLDRFRHGDELAAETLFSRYVGRLIALASSRLSARMSRRIDPEDVVQSAYRSFFLHARDGRFVLQNSGDLWRLLVVITLNKVRQQVEFHSAGKRRIDTETQLGAEEGPFGLAPDVITREPSPAEALAVIEEIEKLTEDLTPQQREIVELRLQGYRIEEIAHQMFCSERTVRRVMDKVKARLQKRLAESRRK